MCLVLLLVTGSGATWLMAQPGVNYESQTFSLKGYVKYMQVWNIVDGFDSLLTDNLIHNRLNLRYYPNDNLKFRVDLRNRVFYGDFVRYIPNYSQFIDGNNDYFDLSATPLDQKNLIFHTMIDRALVEWNNNNWNITLGRQRINWGIELAWNPNDIFNAYSFFDFDYEERPGSDALRVVYYTGVASSVEFATKMADDLDQMVSAGLWKFNQWNYDFQVLGGIANGDVVLGGGWSGSIVDAGFKGEFSYFTPFTEENQDAAFVASIGADYSFSNSMYLYGSYLFNSNASQSNSLFLLNTSSDQVTAKNLLPFKHTVFLQGMYPFHPLINAGLATMYFPSAQGLFINPNLTISLKENWDFDAIGQIFLADDRNGNFGALSKLVYFRFKWSF